MFGLGLRLPQHPAAPGRWECSKSPFRALVPCWDKLGKALWRCHAAGTHLLFKHHLLHAALHGCLLLLLPIPSPACLLGLGILYWGTGVGTAAVPVKGLVALACDTLSSCLLSAHSQLGPPGNLLLKRLRGLWVKGPCPQARGLLCCPAARWQGQSKPSRVEHPAVGTGGTWLVSLGRLGHLEQTGHQRFPVIRKTRVGTGSPRHGEMSLTLIFTPEAAQTPISWLLGLAEV